MSNIDELKAMGIIDVKYCKKCKKELEQKDYVFKGYCENCCDKSNKNVNKNYYEEENVFTVINIIVSIISVVICIWADLEVWLYEFDFFVLTPIMIFELVWAYLARYVGLKKHIYSGYVWGYFLGIIGFIVVCVLPKEKKENNNIITQNIFVPDEIEKYKKLLDSGAITQEEYDKKKKELLNL